MNVTLGEKTHLKGVHGNGFGDMPDDWNQKWQEYIDNNPNASSKETYQQLGRRQKIPDLEINLATPISG